jgi:hypothetical protein
MDTMDALSHLSSPSEIQREGRARNLGKCSEKQPSHQSAQSNPRKYRGAEESVELDNRIDLVEFIYD